MIALLLWLACTTAPEAAPPAPAPPAAAPAEPAAPPPRPLAVDLHVDTPTQLHRKGLPLDAREGLEAGLPQLRAADLDLTVQVLWPPTAEGGRAHTFALLERVEAEVARLDGVALARSPDEARAIAARGQHAVIYGLEGAHGLGPDWRGDLRALHARGLAVLGLTWSVSNRFAGSSGDGGGGLTDEGRALVEEARRLGLVLDLSHASSATTLEVCEGAIAPVIASHSDARALKDHPRNLQDDELRCIARSGGVIGVNLHRPFLPGAGDVQAAADVADHLRAVAGPGAVALGSDYDGLIRTPVGMPDASHLPSLWAELAARGWTQAELDAARGESFLRAWAAVQAAAERP